jgi:hypothetical protein
VSTSKAQINLQVVCQSSQNFIQRNINYVIKLNERVKEKRHNRDINTRTTTTSITRNGIA